MISCFQGVVEKIQQLPESLPQNSAGLSGPQRLFWEVFHNQARLGEHAAMPLRWRCC